MRALRPFVIGRKISGGSRSPQGSAIRCDLARGLRELLDRPRGLPETTRVRCILAVVGANINDAVSPIRGQYWTPSHTFGRGPAGR